MAAKVAWERQRLDGGVGFRVLTFRVGSGERVGGAWGRQNTRGYGASLGSHGIQGIMQGHIGSSFVHELYTYIFTYRLIFGSYRAIY